MHATVLLPDRSTVQLLETTNGDWLLFSVFKVKFSIVTVMSPPVTTMLIDPFVEVPVIVWSPDEIASILDPALYSQPVAEADLPPTTGVPSTVSMSVENSVLPLSSIL